MKQNNWIRFITVSSLLLAGLLFIQCGGKEEAPESTENTEAEAAGPDGADVEAGKKLYVDNGCQVCHGDTGLGDGPGGAALNPPARNFSKKGDYKAGTSQEEIAQSILTGMPPMMAAYPQINEEDRMKIAAFIVSVQN